MNVRVVAVTGPDEKLNEFIDLAKRCLDLDVAVPLDVCERLGTKLITSYEDLPELSESGETLLRIDPLRTTQVGTLITERVVVLRVVDIPKNAVQLRITASA